MEFIRLYVIAPQAAAYLNISMPLILAF
jgi:hypothetical protein